MAQTQARNLPIMVPIDFSTLSDVASWIFMEKKEHKNPQNYSLLCFGRPVGGAKREQIQHEANPPELILHNYQPFTSLLTVIGLFYQTAPNFITLYNTKHILALCTNPLWKKKCTKTYWQTSSVAWFRENIMSSCIAAICCIVDAQQGDRCPLTTNDYRANNQSTNTVKPWSRSRNKKLFFL